MYQWLVDFLFDIEVGELVDQLCMVDVIIEQNLYEQVVKLVCVFENVVCCDLNSMDE